MVELHHTISGCVLIQVCQIIKGFGCDGSEALHTEAKMQRNDVPFLGGQLIERIPKCIALLLVNDDCFRVVGLAVSQNILAHQKIVVVIIFPGFIDRPKGVQRIYLLDQPQSRFRLDIQLFADGCNCLIWRCGFVKIGCLSEPCIVGQRGFRKASEVEHGVGMHCVG